MNQDIEEKLEPDEYTILKMPEDERIKKGVFGSEKLLLTNKRLIFEKSRNPIRLEDISEAKMSKPSMGIPKVYLRLKDGSEIDITFAVYGFGTGFAKGESYVILKQEIITEKWFNAINNEIAKAKRT